MLGWGAKMLSCPVLKQFAVLSSRRLQYRSSPSRESKKARSKALDLASPQLDRLINLICSKSDLLCRATIWMRTAGGDQSVKRRPVAAL
jgi:hypothetical protein